VGTDFPWPRTSAKYLFTRKFLVSKGCIAPQNITANQLFKVPCLLLHSKFYYRSKVLREAFLSNWSVLWNTSVENFSNTIFLSTPNIPLCLLTTRAVKGLILCNILQFHWVWSLPCACELSCGFHRNTV